MFKIRAVEKALPSQLSDLGAVETQQVFDLLAVEIVSFDQIGREMPGIAALKRIIEPHGLPEGILRVQRQQISGNVLLTPPQAVFILGNVFRAPQVAGMVFIEEIVEEVHGPVELHHIPVGAGEMGDIALPETSRSRGNQPDGLTHLLSQPKIVDNIIDHIGHQVVR